MCVHVCIHKSSVEPSGQNRVWAVACEGLMLASCAGMAAGCKNIQSRVWAFSANVQWSQTKQVLWPGKRICSETNRAVLQIWQQFAESVFLSVFDFANTLMLIRKETEWWTGRRQNESEHRCDDKICGWRRKSLQISTSRIQRRRLYKLTETPEDVVKQFWSHSSYNLSFVGWICCVALLENLFFYPVYIINVNYTHYIIEHFICD